MAMAVLVLHLALLAQQLHMQAVAVVIKAAVVLGVVVQLTFRVQQILVAVAVAVQTVAQQELVVVVLLYCQSQQLIIQA
jgi:hypothetical protein